MRTWIRNPLAVWTGTGADAANGIVVEEGRIAELVATGNQPAADIGREFDASGLVVVPGLINCHHHFYQTLTRALPCAMNKELFDWLRSLYPVWAGITDECVHVSTKLALAELMLSGCSTAADHHYLFTDRIPDAIDIQAEVAWKLGTRVVFTRGSMSLSHKDGGLPPDSVVQNEDVILAESERLIRTYHDPVEGAAVQIALAPCSPFSVTKSLMKETADLARKHGVLLHTHLAETEDENEFCLAHFGVRPLDLLDEIGWLDSDVWLAHGIWFDDGEVSRLGSAGVGVSHCPSSNMLLASGFCRALELEAAGAPVGLGVDGSASNDSSNMMQEARQAFLLQRIRCGSAAVTHEDALRWATAGGARILHRPELGTLEPGSAADIALFDLDDLRFSGSGDPVAALVLCGAHAVEHLMIDGVWRVTGGELNDMDVPRLRARHQELASQLAARA